jgi:formate dehydrogenase maturation protein FdhE
MWDQRARRARLLAERYPASREILTFYAGLADWQGRDHNIESLLDLVIRTGPPALAAIARALDPGRFQNVIREYRQSPDAGRETDFFARAFLQPQAAAFPDGMDCPWCPRPPLAGCLRQQGDGLAFEIVCAMCLRRRPFPRTRCPGCNESSEAKLAGFTAPEFPQLRLQACDSCRGYLLVTDLSKDIHAIPDVDEMAGLPLDLWAIERGYHKLHPNLAGI